MAADNSSTLDSFISAYQPDFPYAIDNELLVNWYPQRLVKRVNGESLLELGVGHGWSIDYLSNYFKRHLVIEGSPEIIKKFQGQFPECKAEIVEGYFETFDTTERFDVIAMGFILEHVDDPALILNHYRKFLRKGGSIFVAVPNAEALNKRIGYEAGMIDDFFILNAGDLALGHQRIFSLETLRDLFRKTGYKEIAMEGLLLKPFSTPQLNSLNLPPEVWQALLKVGINYPELCVAVMAQLQDDRV